LIELLVATVILAVGLVAVLQVYVVCANAVGISQESVTTTLLLKEHVTQLEIEALEDVDESSSQWLGKGGYKGQYRGFRWETSVRPSGHEKLNELELQITRDQDEPARGITVTTYADAEPEE